MADAGIILAAGTGSRMGRTKQLLPWQGKPLLAHVLETALSQPLNPLVLVLGHDADRIRQALDATGPGLDRVILVNNPDYRSGLASSLVAGLKALDPISPPLRGALFLLADQPRVGPRTLRAILERAGRHPDSIIIPTCRGRRGTPVYFSRCFFPELKVLEGDQGGRVLFDRHPDRCIFPDLFCDGVVRDVDTPEEYQALLAETENTR